MGRKRSLYAKAITFLIQGPANTLHRGETKRGQRGNKYEQKKNSPSTSDSVKVSVAPRIRQIIAATIRSSWNCSIAARVCCDMTNVVCRELMPSSALTSRHVLASWVGGSVTMRRAAERRIPPLSHALELGYAPPLRVEVRSGRAFVLLTALIYF